jgi:hypothetical protein
MLGDFGCQLHKAGDLGRAEVSTLSLAQQSDQINRRIRTEVRSHDTISSAFALATPGKADLADASRPPDLIALPRVVGNRIDDRPDLVIGKSSRIRVADELRQ